MYLREPYVGEGVDGARRSARIDIEEAETLPAGRIVTVVCFRPSDGPYKLTFSALDPGRWSNDRATMDAGAGTSAAP